MTKEELKQYRHLGLELERLDDTIARLQSEIESPKCQIITDMPRGGNPPTMEDKIAKLLDIQDVYNRQWDKLIDLRRQIELAIVSVKDSRERTLLGYRYIDGLSWEEICVKMHYEWDSIHRIHRLALKDISHYRTLSYIS